jgi:hypothetical protein
MIMDEWALHLQRRGDGKGEPFDQVSEGSLYEVANLFTEKEVTHV